MGRANKKENGAKDGPWYQGLSRTGCLLGREAMRVQMGRATSNGKGVTRRVTNGKGYIRSRSGVILNNKRAAKRKAHFSENTEINFQINFKQQFQNNKFAWG
jgi:hypothetical protein